ncbi:MAG: hypothetical protein ACPGXK_02535 [Phycisphaerae bacterium]
MKTLTSADITPEIWHAAGNPGHLTEAWRQAHYAAQVVSEVGKSWSTPQTDDSHSNLGWIANDKHTGFTSHMAVTERPFQGFLSLPDLSLHLIASSGESIAKTELNGQTLAQANAWLENAATEVGGPRRQPATPAPDLPEHPIASGEKFNNEHADALRDLCHHYWNADNVLQKLVPLLTDAGEQRCWPHHFDHAALSIVKKDEYGQMLATVGVGFSPPDGTVDEGYWYVGPWHKTGEGVGDAWPILPHGAWRATGGAMPLGTLPLSDFAADPSSETVCHFVAAAINACVANLAPGD